MGRVRRGVHRVRWRLLALQRDLATFLAHRRPVPAEPALFVYGHSMAADTAVPAPWPRFVAPALGLPLVNRAVGGDVSAQTARRARLHRGRPGTGDLVLVHQGLNDVARLGHRPDMAARLGRRLRRIVRRLSSAGATVYVLADVTLPAWDLFQPMDHGSPEANAAMRAEVLAIPGAIDLAEGWDATRMLLPDGVHPNEAGAAHIARVVLEALAARGWTVRTAT